MANSRGALPLGEVLESLLAFEKLLDRWDCRDCWKHDFTARFDLIPSSADPELETVLFTGYYQPVIEGSLVPTPEYAYPIYAMPADLIVTEQATLTPSTATVKTVGRLEGGNLVPYYSRREIDELGSLRGRGYEIAWVKNPIDLVFSSHSRIRHPPIGRWPAPSHRLCRRQWSTLSQYRTLAHRPR